MIRTFYFFIVFSFFSTYLISQPPSIEKMDQSREFFNSGVKNGIEEKFENAISDFKKAIDLNPLYSEAFLYKGLAEIEMQNYDQAVKDLTITIELDPVFSDQAHYFRGLTRYLQNNFNAAIDDLTVAIRMNPDYVAFYQRGKANLKLKEYRRSLQDFDIALRLKEDFYEAHLYRGINLYYLKMNEEAMEDLEIAKKYLPNNAEAHYYSGLVRMSISNNYVAMEDLDKALALDPSLAQANQARQQARSNTQAQVVAPETILPAPQPPVRSVARQADPNQSHTPARRSTEVATINESSQSSPTSTTSTDINFAELFSASRHEQREENSRQQEIENQQLADANSHTNAHSYGNSSVILPETIDQLPSGTYGKNLEKATQSGFGVQVASYSSTGNLISLSQAYADKYSKPVFVNISNVNGRKMFKLIIGHFDNRADAESFRNILRNDNFPDSFLIVFNNL